MAKKTSPKKPLANSPKPTAKAKPAIAQTLEATEPKIANLAEFHRTLAEEFRAIKDRVDHLTDHRGTKGGFKESVLRTILRRFLPTSLTLGTGFIVNEANQSSSQIDILIVDSNYPILFKDGDLMIVTPNAVRGIIEVKTGQEGPKKIAETIEKLSTCRQLCDGSTKRAYVFARLFVYDRVANVEKNLLSAVRKVAKRNGHVPTAAALGTNCFAHCHADEAGNFPSPGFFVFEVEDFAHVAFVLEAATHLTKLDKVLYGNVWDWRICRHTLIGELNPSSLIIKYVGPTGQGDKVSTTSAARNARRPNDT